MSTKQFTRAPRPFDKLEVLGKLLEEAGGLDAEAAKKAAMFLLAKERKNLLRSIFY